MYVIYLFFYKYLFYSTKKTFYFPYNNFSNIYLRIVFKCLLILKIKMRFYFIYKRYKQSYTLYNLC